MYDKVKFKTRASPTLKLANELMASKRSDEETEDCNFLLGEWGVGGDHDAGVEASIMLLLSVIISRTK